MATRRHFTQEYKDQALSLALDSGRTIVEVARSIGVHEMTLGKWVKKAQAWFVVGVVVAYPWARSAKRL